MNRTPQHAQVHEETIVRLMETYGTVILRLCCAYLGDVHLAEDAAQETFLKAYRSLDGFRNVGTLGEKAWITRIAINTCKDQLRSAWFRHVDRGQTPESIDIADRRITNEDRLLMYDVLRLPAKYKDVILLHYYQDLPTDVIARILRIGKTTVYKRLSKARAKLRVLLERGNE